MARPPSSLTRRLLLGSDPIRRSIYIVGLMPAVWTFYLGVMDELGADPQNVLERTLGLWALRFLILTLAITPLRRLGGPNWIRYRRTLGLLAFYYAAMHLSVYLVLDQGLDFAAIWADIVKRPYITVGMLAFTMLVPLAVTSNNASIRRLGGSAWARLHKLVYVAVAAAALHFIMLAKVWAVEPLVYAAIVAVLLGYRLVAYLTKEQRKRVAVPLSPLFRGERVRVRGRRLLRRRLLPLTPTLSSWRSHAPHGRKDGEMGGARSRPYQQVRQFGQRADLAVGGAGQALAALAVAVAPDDAHAERRGGVGVPGVGGLEADMRWRARRGGRRPADRRSGAA